MCILGLVLATFSTATGQQTKRPNILIIMSDDVGYWNVSYNNRGMMGYRTPNIDRLANEGLIFTDYYAEQSCTAGRSAFITGQSTVRTGLTKVGLPGAKVGLQHEDPTLAELLKPLGYATGQFGKNHLGDRNEYLPTVHGFDEFFGNLYHLNAEEEPEHRDYPKNPRFHKRFGPRGVLRCVATKTDSGKTDPRFGAMGKQKCTDTGPLTKKRMETVDEEFLKAALNFIEKAHKAKKPFFVWFNSTRMHFYTHLKPASRGISGPRGNFYSDGMVEHDKHVGVLLKKLDQLGITKNTIVVYTTDNGPHYNEWPDGGISPFRGEKNTNWEGGFRVPAIVRWPGKIKGGSVSNEIVSHLDWVPTLLAAAGAPDIKRKLLSGHKAAGKTFKVHLDGYNILPHLTGKQKTSPRQAFFYFSDDGELLNVRYQDWKLVFAEQRAKGFNVWREPFTQLRIPHLFNLRRDPFERATTEANNYHRWMIKHAFVIVPIQTVVGGFIKTFEKYPPRQKPAKFNLDDVIKKLYENPTGR
ncbi:MAG: arylsulfatase [Alphaproteobacteria bacterium]|nr:arylsulfatase [Alphaproteobacteria bacterium]